MFKKYGFLLGLVLFLVEAQCSDSDRAVLKFEHAASESRFKFVDPASPYLIELRVKYNLDRLTSACRDDVEKVLMVMDWVHHLWKHNGSNLPAKNDPLSILEEVMEHKKQFRCVEYAIVTAGCLNALGITARPLALKTADVETASVNAGHLVVEVYVASLNKWVMIDPQFNLMPVWNGLPLNAVEFQQVLAEKRSKLQFWSMDELCLDNAFAGSSFGVVEPTASDEIGGYVREYLEFIEQYLFYFDTPLTNCRWATDLPQLGSLMLVPLGAKEPTVFQIKYPMTDMTYTNNYNEFYQVPKIK